MPQPTLSILIPTYNRAEYLRECLTSVTATTVDCEILVSDNASPDDTAAVVAGFARQDDRIRPWRHPTNLGLRHNIQHLFTQARGRYFCLLGDDDIILPGNFEKKLAILHAHPEIGLIHSRAYRMDAQGRTHDLLYWPGVLDYSYLGGRNEFADLLQAPHMSLQSVVFHRDLWEAHGGFDLSDPDIANAPSDWGMLLTYCHHTQTAFLAEPLVAVRFHAQSYSQSRGMAAGLFARGRIALWRKWLVDPTPVPVLEERHWQALAAAFVVDLDHEFNGDRHQVDRYLAAFTALKAANRQKAASRIQALTGDPAPADVPSETPPPSLCGCWRCRIRRLLRHWQ